MWNKAEDFVSKYHRVSLNGELLKKLIDSKQMEDGDAIFFYHLLLPISKLAKLGVRDDPCKTFYDVASSIQATIQLMIRSVLQTMAVYSVLQMMQSLSTLNFIVF